MDKRFAEIEILGKKYPLNFSVRVAQEFNELLSDRKDNEFKQALHNIKILSALMRDAADYHRVVLGQEIDTMTIEELELMLTPADNARVVKAINEAVELGGMRLVRAKPKKNEAAEPRKEQPTV